MKKSQRSPADRFWSPFNSFLTPGSPSPSYAAKYHGIPGDERVNGYEIAYWYDLLLKMRMLPISLSYFLCWTHNNVLKKILLIYYENINVLKSDILLRRWAPWGIIGTWGSNWERSQGDKRGKELRRWLKLPLWPTQIEATFFFLILTSW